MTILLAYHGVYGQTLRVCERIQAELGALGVAAEIVPLAEVSDPARYDAIVLGASVRNGKHNRAVAGFVARHRATLDAKPNAFFSVNLVARKPAKNTVETNPYLRAWAEKSEWKPTLLGVFAGDLDYRRYGVLDRNIIRLIMRISGGPTDPETKVEYTNWDEVATFARSVAALVAPGAKAVTVGAAGPRTSPTMRPEQSGHRAHR